MNRVLDIWRVRCRLPLAAAAGILLALAFPLPSVAGLAWVAPTLMLAAAAGTNGRQAFQTGYIAGLAYHLTSLYWLLLIPVKFFPIIGWLALSAYLALYPALWVWGAWQLWPAPHLRPTKPTARPQPIGPLGSGWAARNAWSFGVAALWVALEMIRARLLGGFPWNPLGASQLEMVPLIQLAQWTGVYGVSFLVAWFAASLLLTGRALLHAPSYGSRWMMDLAAPLLAIALCFVGGWQRIRSTPPPHRTLKVAVVQPSIPQTEIWDSEEDEARFAEVIERSQTVLSEQPDLLLWPEAAVPGLIRWDAATYHAITNLAGSSAVWMVIGADDAIRDERDEVRYYNSAWLIDATGAIRDTYRKQQLVAFGEEVPFSRWLPFLKWFTPITGSFTRGTQFVDFHLEDLALETTTLICFEDVFPHLARKSVSADTDFIINLTNDGWFREGAAQQQHAAAAAFRAVETGVPLVRCTNNGQTCWIDPLGRIVEVLRDEQGTIYGPGCGVFSVTLSESRRHPATFYHKHGDVFGWLCSVSALCALGLQWAGRSRRPAPSPHPTAGMEEVNQPDSSEECLKFSLDRGDVRDQSVAEGHAEHGEPDTTVGR